MAVVGTLTVDLVAKTASFEGAMAKAPQTARTAARGIQDSFNGINLTEARGSVALLSDDIGLTLPRHLRSAIAELPGFSAALSAAFPVIAVIAAGVAITEFVEKISKQREEVEKTRREMMDHVDAMGKHAMATELDTLKIEDQIAMMEGRPTVNRLKEALVEAKIAASDLFSQMEKTNAEAIKDLERFSIGKFKTMFTGGQTDPQVDDARAKLEKLTADTKRWRDAVNSGNTDLAASLKATVNDEVATLNIAVNNWKYATDALVQADINDHKKLPRANEPDPRAAAESRQTVARQLQDYLSELVENTQSLLTGYEKKGEADRTAAADTEMQNRIALLDKQYASEKALMDANTKLVIAGFEDQFADGKINAASLTLFKDGELNKQYIAERAHLEQVKALEAGKPALVKATEQQIETLDANHKAKLLENDIWLVNEEWKVFSEQTKAIMSEAEKRNNAELKASDERMAFYNKYQEGAQRIVALQAELSDQDSIQAQKLAIATGHLTEQQAVEQNLAALEKNKADTMKTVIDRLNEQFDLVYKLKNETNSGTTGNDDQIKQYQKAVEDYQTMKTQELEIEKKFQSQVNAARLQAANNEHSQWNKMFLDYSQIQTHMSQFARQELGQINSSIAQLVVTGKGNFQSLATSAIESFIQMALQYAESKAESAIIDAGWFATKKVLNASDANSSAASAAAGTLADVPYPENIPAAASVLAIGEGFAADALARRGAVLPNRDLMVHTHPEEMILPQHISNFIVNAASNATAQQRGGDTHINPVFAPTVHATDAAGVDRILTKHADVFQRHVQRAVRRMNN
jgi:hypothetical protein